MLMTSVDIKDKDLTSRDSIWVTKVTKEKEVITPIAQIELQAARFLTMFSLQLLRLSMNAIESW